ncbi:MAG: hypothetical protein E7461_06080 [Ruminococcaceae bacterium]|nr:hypothetical protein [Oscillospiraceae bacterium]
MWTISDLIANFFTHKDYLPSADKLPGTLFTPMHFVFALLLTAVVIFACIRCRRVGDRKLKAIFAVLWAFLVVFEITKIVWESVSGKVISFEWGGILPLYPCSIFMYAMPFAIWGKGIVRKAACGYVCTLGLLGGLINFVYPANILNNYSCLSFAGFHTLIYHGTLVFCAFAMLISGYHTYKEAKNFGDLIIPAIPCLIMSIPANIVNFSPINADYMFFKLQSFFFAPIGAALPTIVCVLIVYILYMLIHAIPYIPFYIKNRKRMKVNV